MTVLTLVVTSSVSFAVTRLEGYTEVYTLVNGDSRVWHLENPQLLSELRLITSPYPNIEAFLKFQAYSNRWQGATWENLFFLREAHLKYRGNRIETYLFTGQDRFWFSEPLLNIVSNDVVKDDDWGPRAQGIRLDFWDMWGFSGSAFYSERSTGYRRPEDICAPYEDCFEARDQSMDDYRAIRIKRSFVKDRLIIGGTYARKDFGQAEREYDEVVALDFEAALGEIFKSLSRLGRVSLITEAGRNISGWLGDRNPCGWKAELRDIWIGPFSMIASYYNYDDDFYTLGLARGDIWDDNDYYGHYIQIDYRVPMKAINLKGWRYRNKPHKLTSERQPFEETGGEIYIEFVHGFKGRVEYKRHVNKDGVWPNLIFEVSGENNLAKIKTQFRIKDIGTDYQIRIYGFEANANITEKWKFYTRLMSVEEKTESRETVFAQLRYTGWQSAEFFMEFGDWGQSNDLVNTEWFISHENNQTTRRQFKTFLRLYY